MDKHIPEAIYMGTDSKGERWKASCVCGWWVPVRSYMDAVRVSRQHTLVELVAP